MSEVKDPKIKLFGKTIELLDCGAAADQAQSSGSNKDTPEDAEEHESQKSQSTPKHSCSKEENQAELLPSDKDSNSTPLVVQDSSPPSTESDVVSVKTSKPEEDQTETSNSQEKTLKKPDKILPCPRCNSMDTKFCYFNNYNVNQPRHFCKNCQRYWTAGGTMRNVPVGAGRRKNKSSVSQFRNGIHHPVLNPNGTVLTFTSESPLADSMASVLNNIDKTIRNGPRNSEESEDGQSNGSSIKDEAPNCHPIPLQVPSFPGTLWPYPWNSPPTFVPGTFALPPFYSTLQSYWGCVMPAGAWNVPMVIPHALQENNPIATAFDAPSSGPNSPTLGKHSRDDKFSNTKEEEILKEINPEKSLWVPKTLRIDDPEEAAKSSIWTTLGNIKNDKAESIGGGGLFKAFQAQSKSNYGKSRTPETSTVLQANPAALSRSLSFHESS